MKESIAGRFYYRNYLDLIEVDLLLGLGMTHVP